MEEFSIKGDALEKLTKTLCTDFIIILKDPGYNSLAKQGVIGLHGVPIEVLSLLKTKMEEYFKPEDLSVLDKPITISFEKTGYSMNVGWYFKQLNIPLQQS